MQKKYRLTPVGERSSEWDALVKNSAQGSIFSLHAFLKSSQSNFELFFIYKGNEIKAGLVLNLSEDGKKVILDDLVIYNGIIFRQDFEQKLVKGRLEQFEITSFVLVELEVRFQFVELSLHPAFEDLRPILWRHYDDSSRLKRYSVDVRYTSFLDISEFFLQNDEESMKLFANLDNIRQSDIRKARKEKSMVAEDDCVDVFIGFYVLLMEAQSISISKEMQNRIKELLQALLDSRLASLFVVKNSIGQITYVTIFSRFNNTACYLFGAGDENLMSRFDGTICIWDSFKMLALKGISFVDLEGINSPFRGSFKLSFGGDVTPYYHIRWYGNKFKGVDGHVQE
jgi:hypothetical protein